MRRLLICCLAMVAVYGADVPMVLAVGQGYPGGGQMPGSQMPGGRGMGQPGMGVPGDEMPSTPATEKPDAAARKAYAAAMKSLNRAHEYEEAAAKAPNEDKKSAALEKVGDAYNRALDQFTEALSNKGDMVDAWNHVGYVHLRLGAYNESIDDYNHALALNADLLDAVEHRGEAFLAVDRLDDAKAAYMDLFYHSRPLADQLMVSMQKWQETHRVSANGMRPADIDSFGKWLLERDGIAKQTASASAAAPAPTSP
ncbi:MAG TPA: tetratricopeptide repeat protein [Steroidobacteraceae bacterium]|nr:tetratricopeptide repeat protein [Steroidobacteraceae bacterium]